MNFSNKMAQELYIYDKNNPDREFYVEVGEEYET